MARRKRTGSMAKRLPQPLDLSATPACRHFGVCGGCTWQQSPIAAQRAAKAEGVAALLREKGLPDVIHAVHDAGLWRTRNRMEFSFGFKRWILAGEPEGVDRSFALGLHPQRRFDRVFDLEECPVAFEEAEQLVRATRRLARGLGLSTWNPVEHRGLLRQLLVRKGLATGEVLLEIVSDGSADAAVEALAEALLREPSPPTTLSHARHAGFADMTPPNAPRTALHGPGFIHEIVNDVRFRLQPGSFFQPSSRAAAILAELVVQGVRSRKARVVEDWCCGTGFFSLQLARAGVPSVRGIEINAAAIEDARANAMLNNLSAEFLVVDIAEHAASGATAADCIVVDPPRAGLPAAALAALVRAPAARIIFLACDLAASAAQLSALVAGGRQLVRTELVDQFPHTPHVEAVLTLDRNL